ncbi:MAG: translation initiation factor IF-2 [Anaerolineales bacterium]|nr:translation initiation factor IF-2 [Anaerolineales bacterium]
MAELKRIDIPSFLTVRDLADLLEASPIDIIKELMSNGIIANINQQIDFDTAAIVAEELGFEVSSLVVADEEVEEEDEKEDIPEWRKVIMRESEEQLKKRAPVITMLGHVDHGKTSLLDAIRDTRVQAGEAGGITQHMGAYQIEHEGKPITFLDTPGHEAFTAMRARGARATDIAVLVVAADDGVMPQTREAYDHARAAGVPIIVALNKMDRVNANPELVKKQLSDLGLTPDEWGGSTMVIPVSAKTREGLEDLLEAILLVAEDTDIRANPDGKAFGTVIEGQLEKSRGVVATLLIQNGLLHVGDALVAGHTCGKVRAMFDFRGKQISTAGPSVPVRIMGLESVPEAGISFRVVSNEKEAKAIVEERILRFEREAEKPKGYTLDDIFARFKAGEAQSLNLIIKADVQGSLEPIVNSLNDLRYDELKVDILRSDTGNITESDVMLATASDAIVIGFCVEPDTAAQRLAEVHGISIRTYKIIYKLIEDIDKALKGLLEPEYGHVVIGKAEVRAVFHIKRVGQIAGCYIIDGEARRNLQARVWRGDQIVTDGDVGSLRRFEEDVREVRAGFECGVSMQNWDAWQEGDIIEFYKLERIN